MLLAMHYAPHARESQHTLACNKLASQPMKLVPRSFRRVWQLAKMERGLLQLYARASSMQ